MEEPEDDKTMLIDKMDPEKKYRYILYVIIAVLLIIIIVLSVLLAIYIPKGTKSDDDHPDIVNNPPGSSGSTTSPTSSPPSNPPSANSSDASTGMHADPSRSGMRDYGLITPNGRAHIGRLNKLFDNNLTEIFPMYR